MPRRPSSSPVLQHLFNNHLFEIQKYLFIQINTKTIYFYKIKPVNAPSHVRHPLPFWVYCFQLPLPFWVHVYSTPTTKSKLYKCTTYTWNYCLHQRGFFSSLAFGFMCFGDGLICGWWRKWVWKEFGYRVCQRNLNKVTFNNGLCFIFVKFLRFQLRFVFINGVHLILIILS